MSATLDRIAEVILETTGDLGTIITETTTLEDLELDSLDVTEIAFGIEAAFNIDLPDDAVMAARTVGDLVLAVDAVKGGSAS